MDEQLKSGLLVFFCLSICSHHESIKNSCSLGREQLFDRTDEFSNSVFAMAPELKFQN